MDRLVACRMQAVRAGFSEERSAVLLLSLSVTASLSTVKCLITSFSVHADHLQAAEPVDCVVVCSPLQAVL